MGFVHISFDLVYVTLVKICLSTVFSDSWGDKKGNTKSVKTLSANMSTK